MGGKDEKQNIVNLTPEEHFVAHQLLVKIYPSNSSLIHAAHMMGTTRTSNKSYGWLRKHHAAEASKEGLIRWQTADDNYKKLALRGAIAANNDSIIKARRSIIMKERWSDPVNRAILLNRPSQKGRVFSDDHRKNIAKGCIGRVPVNKGTKTGKPAHNRGLPVSEEARQKMRESSKIRWDIYRASK